MVRGIMCFILFGIMIYIWDISQSIKDTKIEVTISPEVTRLDSINNVLIDRINKQEIYYQHQIDSLKRITDNINYKVDRVRKLSTMMP